MPKGPGTARLIIFLLVFGLLIAKGEAHPVAQGSMEISLSSDNLTIVATVSNEQIFVAEALASKEGAETLEEAWRRHGSYLLDHLQVEVDGNRLAGTVEAFAAVAATEHVRYDLRYPLPSANEKPRAISLRQNVLNEFDFAPGNPWEATYVVRSAQLQLPEQSLLFTSKQPLTLTFDLRGTGAPGWTDSKTFGAFVRHGIGHILSGYDHLLFVAGLVLAVVTLWDLVKVVTAFTLAHTLTLTLAVLDIVRMPSQIVEPMIAASIVFVALQNLLAPRQARGHWRLVIAFAFGLFHGLGFAGGLVSAMEGMQIAIIGIAILGFSVGVEIGHQVVALPLFAAVKAAQRYRQSRPTTTPPYLWISRLGSGAIAAGGAVYLAAALHWVR